MIELWVKRSGPELKPARPVDFEHIKDLPENVAIKIKASNGRSSDHHRLFFGAKGKPKNSMYCRECFLKSIGMRLEKK